LKSGTSENSLMSEEPFVVDVRGLHCPFPIKKIRSALDELPAGCEIHMLADDLESRYDVPALLKRLKMPKPEIQERDEDLLFIIQNRKAERAETKVTTHRTISSRPASETSDGGRWPSRLQRIIDDFEGVSSQMERYEMLYDWASNLDTLPEEEWTDANLVHGCQSEAFITAELDDEGKFHLRGASEARIVGGLMAITAVALNGLSATEVADFSLDFVQEMGLDTALTPSRANGFLNMFTKVRQIASTLAE